MTCGRAIGDGDEPLFDFEGLDTTSYNGESSQSPGSSAVTPGLLDMSHIPPLSKLDLASYRDSAASTPAEVVAYISRAQEQDDYMNYGALDGAGAFQGKGKAVSRPVDISSGAARDADFNPYSTSPTSANARRRQSCVSSLSIASPQTFDSFDFSINGISRSYPEGSISTSLTTDITTPGSSYEYDRKQFTAEQTEIQGKGKSRAPPILPPLSFSPTGFEQGETHWPLSSPSPPDAPGSSNGPHVPSGLSFQRPDEVNPRHDRASSRPRSFSSVSTHSTKSSFSAIRSKISKGKRRSTSALRNLFTKDLGNYGLEKEDSAPTNTPSELIRHEPFSSLSAPATPYGLSASRASFSACDARPEIATVERVETRNLFEHLLPREIKLRILQKLLDMHEAEDEIKRDSVIWTARTASESEHRWMGREYGLVELVRSSRVSKSWQQLVFDGQLWTSLDLKAFPMADPDFLLRLTQISGSFVSTVDLTGHTNLTTTSLLDMTAAFCINSNPFGALPSTTQLSCINLSGCSYITIHSLNNLLKRSPQLTKVNVKGLPSVTNETCNILAANCPSLQFLNLSYCYNVDLEGVISLMTVWEAAQRPSPLKGLRIAGLRRINVRFMSLLGRYAPNLEVLDLTSVRGLQNCALAAYVTCPDDEVGSDSVLLTSRQAGRDPGDPTKYRRRLTKLRHLSLSQCPLISDIACSNLAHALPKLELLELAGMGAELKDDGLVRLLKTTPHLRRLDLDEASDITDATIAALTPPTEEHGNSTIWTGMHLEQLNLSYAAQLSSEALHGLIRACPKLKHLELDNTRVSGLMVKEFVRLSRKREASDARIVVVDCRGVGENAIKDLVDETRTRGGWRGWDARYLHYLDARDNEGLGVGTDECDDKRVTLKSFYSWQSVDAIEAAREKQRKANAKHGRNKGGEDYFSIGRNSKWWSPGARRGRVPPISTYRDRDSCIIM